MLTLINSIAEFIALDVHDQLSAYFILIGGSHHQIITGTDQMMILMYPEDEVAMNWELTFQEG